MADVRPCTAENLRDGVSPITHFFGRGMDDETYGRFVRNLPPERMHAAWEDGCAVAAAGAFPFELTVPGGRVPAAGITLVGVLPTHRRRGLLTQLMRAQLDDVHARREPIAYLWASEGAIYPRFGYGIASLGGEIAIPRNRTSFAVPVEPLGPPRLVGHEEALELLPRVYDAVAAAVVPIASTTRVSPVEALYSKPVVTR